jgi:hypothetical protein
MLGIRQGVTAGNGFKKVEILPVPNLYIYSLMLFVVVNLHYFQTNSLVHEITTRYNNQLLYLRLDFLLYSEVPPALLLRYTTKYHL